MLNRVRGGATGVVEYLQEGRKSGRDYTRDELDHRLHLQGDLSSTGAVIDGMNSTGERYLHITISFREDQVDDETLSAIAEDFRQFAMAAYAPDEYSFYAEAHLPKIRSYTNSATGQFVERKPHIHIVIPETNLLTGQRLEPLGLVENQIGYLDAWQERTNSKYGLASPKDFRRLEFTPASKILSRVKGDIFKGPGHELKTEILGQILERNIQTREAFEALLTERGEVRERNAGRAHAYFNVKPEGQPRGVNLKEFVFSREFLELSKDQKIARLAQAERKELETAKRSAADELRIDPDARLFADFRSASAAGAEARADAMAAQQAAEKARFGELRERQGAERALIEGDTSRRWTDRKAALSVMRLEHSVEQDALRREINAERRDLERQHGLPAQYQAFLRVRAEAGDELAQAELERQMAAGVIDNGRAEPTPTSFSLAGTSTMADRAGRVSWLDDSQRVLMIDAGHKVVVPTEDERAIEGGLRLALAKYGSRRELALDGTDDFKRAAVEIAAREGLTIRFADPEMQVELDRLRTAQGTPSRELPARELTQAEKEDALVHEWHERRAHELRWIPSSGSLSKRYREASPEQRAEILAERAEAYNRRWRSAEIESTRLPTLDRKPERVAPELPAPRANRDGRPDDSVLGQLIGDLHKEREISKDAGVSELARIKQELDATRLLATVSRTHGVLIEKYGVVKGKGGEDLIEAGNRRLPVNDFLTKEMHLPWADAKKILRAVYREQQSEPAERAKPEPRRDLWNAYLRDWKPGQRARKSAAMAAHKASGKERREAIRKDAADRKYVIEDSGMHWRDRKAALAVLRLETAAAQLQLRETIAAEKAALDKLHSARPDEQYRAFLADRASKGDELALDELRKQREALAEPEQAAGRIVGDEVKPSFAEGLNYTVDRRGNVAYSRSGQTLLVDAGSKLSIPTESREAIEAGLHLARAKFGARELQLDGTPEFRAMAVEIAAREKIGIRFADPEMQASLERQRELIAQQMRDRAEAQRLAIKEAQIERERAAASAAAQERGEGKDSGKSPFDRKLEDLGLHRTDSGLPGACGELKDRSGIVCAQRAKDGRIEGLVVADKNTGRILHRDGSTKGIEREIGAHVRERASGMER